MTSRAAGSPARLSPPLLPARTSYEPCGPQGPLPPAAKGHADRLLLRSLNLSSPAGSTEARGPGCGRAGDSVITERPLGTCPYSFPNNCFLKKNKQTPTSQTAQASFERGQWQQWGGVDSGARRRPHRGVGGGSGAGLRYTVTCQLRTVFIFF